ncbi:MAG: LamG domain-containing protein [Spirochaetales bacterium]|nr:LamG domain-containing protein [Spirochaetales bacterium]
MNYQRTSFLLIFLLILLSPLSADEVELMNGDLVTGKIISMDEQIIRLRTSFGVVEVERRRVKTGFFGPYNELPQEGLIAYFPFNGGLNDFSGQNRELFNSGTVIFSDGVDSSEESAFESNGTGQYLYLEESEELNTLNSFTLCFWIYREDRAGTHYMVSKWENSSEDRAEGKFALSYRNQDITFYIVDKTGYYHSLRARDVLLDERWNHVAASFEGGTLRLYVNGESVAEEKIPEIELYVDSSPLVLLSAKSSTDDPWGYYNVTGRIDNFRLYNRGLSDKEIEIIYKEKG